MYQLGTAYEFHNETALPMTQIMLASEKVDSLTSGSISLAVAIWLVSEDDMLRNIASIAYRSEVDLERNNWYMPTEDIHFIHFSRHCHVQALFAGNLFLFC